MVELKIIKNIQYLSSCSEADLLEMARFCEKVIYRENDVVYYEGDPADYIYFIVTGSVDMYLNVDNDKVLHSSQLHEGDMFGAGEIFHDAYYLSTRAVTKSTLIRISKANFFKRFLTIPGFNKLIMDDFANIIKLAVVNNKYFYGINRILLFLHHCCRNLESVNNKCMLDRSVTIEKIAVSLNLTREHVSRLISELKKRSIIEKSGNRLIVNITLLLGELEYDDIYEKIKF